MNLPRRVACTIVATLALAFTDAQTEESGALQIPLATQAEKAYFDTLSLLSDSLLQQQNLDENDPEFGGLLDPENNIYYTRAAEVVYPFTVLYRFTGNTGLSPAIVMSRTGNSWLPKA